MDELLSSTWESMYNTEALGVLLDEADARRLDWEDPFLGLKP
jgi:hypothetical protein